MASSLNIEGDVNRTRKILVCFHDDSPFELQLCFVGKHLILAACTFSKIFALDSARVSEIIVGSLNADKVCD
jgi:hypothetical protein